MNLPGVLKRAAEARSFKKELVLITANVGYPNDPEGNEHNARWVVAAILNLRRVGIEHYLAVMMEVRPDWQSDMQLLASEMKTGLYPAAVCQWTSYLTLSPPLPPFLSNAAPGHRGLPVRAKALPGRRVPVDVVPGRRRPGQKGRHAQGVQLLAVAHALEGARGPPASPQT